MTGFASTGALIYDVEKIKIEISWLTTGQFEDFGKVFDEKFIANLLEKIGKYIFSNYFNVGKSFKVYSFCFLTLFWLFFAEFSELLFTFRGYRLKMC